MKKVENLNAKSPQYCVDTTKSGSVHAIDMRGHIHYRCAFLPIYIRSF